MRVITFQFALNFLVLVNLHLFYFVVVLFQVHRGVSIIVTDHSNTERPFINAFIDKFKELLNKHNDPQIDLIKSEADRDALEYI